MKINLELNIGVETGVVVAGLLYIHKSLNGEDTMAKVAKRLADDVERQVREALE
jgi:hypothetical protein